MSDANTYYIYKTLVIEYVSKSNKICKINMGIGIKRKKGIHELLNEDETEILFEEKKWINDTYRKKYEAKLREIYDIYTVTKIYKQRKISTP